MVMLIINRLQIQIKVYTYLTLKDDAHQNKKPKRGRIRVR